MPELTPLDSDVIRPDSSSVFPANSPQNSPATPQLATAIPTSSTVISGVQANVFVDQRSSTNSIEVRASEVAQGLDAAIALYNDGSTHQIGAVAIDRSHGIGTSLLLSQLKGARDTSLTRQSTIASESDALNHSLIDARVDTEHNSVSNASEDSLQDSQLFNRSLFGAAGLPDLSHAAVGLIGLPQGLGAGVFLNGEGSPVAIARTTLTPRSTALLTNTFPTLTPGTATTPSIFPDSPDPTRPEISTTDTNSGTNSNTNSGTNSSTNSETNSVEQFWGKLALFGSLQATNDRGLRLIDTQLNADGAAALNLQDGQFKGAAAGTAHLSARLWDTNGNPLLNSYLRSLGVSSFGSTGSTFQGTASGAVDMGASGYVNGVETMSAGLKALGTATLGVNQDGVQAALSGATEAHFAMNALGTTIDTSLQAIGANTFRFDQSGMHHSAAGAVDARVNGLINQTALPNLATALPWNEVLNWTGNFAVNGSGLFDRNGQITTIQMRGTLREILTGMTQLTSGLTSFFQGIGTSVLSGLSSAMPQEWTQDNSSTNPLNSSNFLLSNLLGSILTQRSIANSSRLNTTQDFNSLLPDTYATIQPSSSISSSWKHSTAPTESIADLDTLRIRSASTESPSTELLSTKPTSTKPTTTDSTQTTMNLDLLQTGLSSIRNWMPAPFNSLLSTMPESFDRETLQAALTGLSTYLGLPANSINLNNPQVGLQALAQRLGLPASGVNFSNPEAALTTIATALLTRNWTNPAAFMSQPLPFNLTSADLAAVVGILSQLTQGVQSGLQSILDPILNPGGSPSNPGSTPNPGTPNNPPWTPTPNNGSNGGILPDIRANPLPNLPILQPPTGPLQTIDILMGSTRRDQLRGYQGRDRIRGQRGNDWISGGEGEDELFGGQGSDRLLGDAGDDQLFGESGNDRLFGGAGDDLCVGGAGLNFLTGGQGEDTFALQRGRKFNVIRDFQDGQDWLGLANGMKFSQVSLQQVGNATHVRFGNDLLAVLQNVSVSQLTAADFTQA